MKLGLMVSGGLGLTVLKKCFEEYSVVAVLTDKNSSEIIQFSSLNSIPCFVGNPRGGKTYDFINHNPIDLALSINYLFIVESDIIQWPVLGAVNFHGSLLPKYRGRTPHVWAIINNEQKTGVTAHYITEGCDEGDILNQIEIDIELEDTGADILNKFNSLYPKVIKDTITQFSSNSISRREQNNQLATFFGKRTPEDGKIDWSWQKERIRNWVRAQAYPYPGAFSYIQGNKVVIDKVEFDDFGFNQNQKDGTVLTLNPIRVKTPNGTVRLSSVREGVEWIKEFKILE